MAVYFTAQGFDVATADSRAAADQAVSTSLPDVAVVDYRLPDGDGISLLTNWRATQPPFPTIFLSGHGSIDLAVRATKEGAEHFFTKPVELPALLAVVERALEGGWRRRRELLERERESSVAPDPFLGTSAAVRDLRRRADAVLEATSPILLQGETGTGKGVLAHWLHRHGPRASRSMVEINCSSLSRELMESELFGHEPGAFTDARATKYGLLEVAHRGTIFLDEVGDLDGGVQPRLLKVVEDRIVRRVGGVRDRQVDVRWILATHRDLAQLVRDGGFRADLYYRISALTLRVPALRERREDIPVLARELLGRLNFSVGRGHVSLAPECDARLSAYSWPGNVRELRNVLERAVLLGSGPVIGPSDLALESGPGAELGGETLREVEARHIEQVLRSCGGRVSVAAERLGISRAALYDRIGALRLDLSEFRTTSLKS